MTATVAAEKKDEKVEKRRALGRGLESLLPGPRVLPVAPTLAQSARKDGAPAPAVNSLSASSASAASSAAQTSSDADPPGLLYQGTPAAIPQDQGMAGLRLAIISASRPAQTDRLSWISPENG